MRSGRDDAHAQRQPGKMHTFKKLPTMQPSAKKTSDQKWNGTSDSVRVENHVNAHK